MAQREPMDDELCVWLVDIAAWACLLGAEAERQCCGTSRARRAG